MDLAEFVKARLDEDEAAAHGCMNCGQSIKRAITATGWTHGDRSGFQGWQGVRCPGGITGALSWPDPARVLREVEAKRAILNGRWGGPDHEDMWEHNVRLLAAVWRDHPGWRDDLE